MLLKREGFLNSPSVQSDSKPWGQRPLWAAMEAICLVVMAQQVSPGWVGEGGGWGRLLKTCHPSRNKIAPEAQYEECPPHTVTHSPRSRHNKPCLRVFTLLCLFCSFVRGGRPIKWSRDGRNGKNSRGHHRCRAHCLFLFQCHKVKLMFFCFFSPLLLEKDTKAAPVLDPGLGHNTLIITANMLLQTLLHLWVHCMKSFFTCCKATVSHLMGFSLCPTFVGKRFE